MNTDLVPTTLGAAELPPSPAHQLGAVADDWEALAAWLDMLKRKRKSPATLATYEREIRRLRWYCQFAGAPRLSLWTEKDAAAYQAFLEHRSAEFPCPGGVAPGDPGWTPFRARRKESGRQQKKKITRVEGQADTTSQMTLASVDASMRILRSAVRYWQEAGYVRGNPFLAAAAQRSTGSRDALPSQVLQLVRDHMDRQPRKKAQDHLLYWRNRFILTLFERTGVRANEAAKGNMVDVYPMVDQRNAKMHWVFMVNNQKGGGDPAPVPLDAVVMDDFRAYRRAFGLPETPSPIEVSLGLILSPHTRASEDSRAYSTPRLRRRQGRWRSLRTRQSVWNIVSELFDSTAAALGPGPAADLLRRASTHWLRHTRATNLVMANVDVRQVAKLLRHGDIRTTMRYDHSEFFDAVYAIPQTR